jgi:hypothetical protein
VEPNGAAGATEWPLDLPLVNAFLIVRRMLKEDPRHLTITGDDARLGCGAATLATHGWTSPDAAMFRRRP